MGLVRGAVRQYCLGGCSALVVCARRSRAVRGGWVRCTVLCFPRFPVFAPRFLRCVWQAVLSRCPLSSLARTPFHAVCALRGLGPVALLVFLVCLLSVCVLALSRRPRPPPLPGLVWCAHFARSRCWALVGPVHAVRALPRVLPRSRAPFGLFWGGAAQFCFPPTWLGAVCSCWGGSALPGRTDAGRLGGLGGRRPAHCPPRCCGRGGQLGRGSPYLSPSLCLPWASNKAGVFGSGHGGRGPHTAPVCVRLLSPDAVRVAFLCPGAGSLVHRSSRGGRRLGAWRRTLLRPPPPPGRRGPSRGRGDRPLCFGGGVTPWFPTSLPCPPFVAGRGLPPTGQTGGGG